MSKQISFSKKLFQTICICVATFYFWIGISQSIAWAESTAQNSPVIEWIEYAVPVAEQKQFIEKEREIWEPVNQRSPNYVSKEVWQDPEQPDHIFVMNHWLNPGPRKEIDAEIIRETEEKFDAAVGKSYPIIRAKTFRDITN